jgi:hypothetical protein
MPSEASAHAVFDRFRGPAALVLLLANGVLLFCSLLYVVVPVGDSPGLNYRLLSGTNSFLSLTPLVLPVVALLLVTAVRPALRAAVPMVAAVATAELGAAALLGLICELGGQVNNGIAWQTRLIGFIEALAWLAVFAVALAWAGRTWLMRDAVQQAPGQPGGERSWVTGEVVQEESWPPSNAWPGHATPGYGAPGQPPPVAYPAGAPSQPWSAAPPQTPAQAPGQASGQAPPFAAPQAVGEAAPSAPSAAPQAVGQAAPFAAPQAPGQASGQTPPSPDPQAAGRPGHAPSQTTATGYPAPTPPTTYGSPRSDPPRAQSTAAFNAAEYLPHLPKQPPATEDAGPGIADAEPEPDPDDSVTKAFRAPDAAQNPHRIPDSEDPSAR